MTMICRTWTVTQKEKLDAFLRKELPSIFPESDNTQLSNSKIRRLIIAGGVSVNSRQCRVPSYDLYPGSKVSVSVDEKKFFFEKQPDDIQFTLTSENVLFEDDSIIVVNKPAFFPTEETMVKSRNNMHQAVIDYLWKKNPSLRNPPYAGIMHRLDRETSGVLLFTKNRQVNQAVHDMFEKHTAVKKYRAVCSFNKKLQSQKTASFNSSDLKKGFTFTADNFIGRISLKSQGCKIGILPETKGGQRAVTDFEIADIKNELYFVDCVLHTGRTHQIRVHLSSSGLPILGDELYGGKTGFEKNKGRIMLHAKSLTFPHPVTGKIITVEAPLPDFF